jgi:hypothetical protein
MLDTDEDALPSSVSIPSFGSVVKWRSAMMFGTT